MRFDLAVLTRPATTRRIAFTAGALFAALLACRVAAAQPDDAGARVAFDEGVRLFADEDYPAALAAFERSYAMNPKASVLFNIGMCQKALFRYAESLATFRKYLAESGEKMKAERRAEAETAITEMEKLVGQIQILEAPDGARVLIDGVERGVAPLAEPLVVDPGRHAIEVYREGYSPLKVDVAVASGAKTVIHAVLEPEGTTDGAPPAATGPAPDGKPGTLAPAENNCANVTCSNHGTCVLKQGDPYCACNEGYAPDATTGLSCIPTQVAPPAPPGLAAAQTPDASAKAGRKKSTPFLRSVFSFQLEGGFGGASGEIIDEEEKGGKVTATYADGSTKTAKPTNFRAFTNPSFELAPLRSEHVRLAIRVGYEFSHLDESATVDGGSYGKKEYDERLLLYHAVLIGSALYLGNTWWHFNLFFSTGPAFAGKLKPFAAAQKANPSIDIDEADFWGWAMHAGGGIGFSFSHFLAGSDIYYCPTVIKLDSSGSNEIYPGNSVSDASWIHELGVTMYLGFYI